MKTGFAFLGSCALVGGTGLLHAQTWQPVVFNPGSISLVTTGGVTYATYTWGMGGCLELGAVGPVVHKAGDFSFNFDLQFETGVACPEDMYLESGTVVLGPLAAGDYTLTTTSWGAPVATNRFTVPTNSTPMLEPIGFAANGAFQIRLNGVANVGYVLQCSTNFVNWTSLSTNSIGLPLTDTRAVLSVRRFYRAQILQTVTFGPGAAPP